MPGLARFGGQGSAPCGCEPTGSDVLLIMINRTAGSPLEAGIEVGWKRLRLIATSWLGWTTPASSCGLGRGELTTLVGIKDLWSAATREGHSSASMQNWVSKLVQSLQPRMFLEKRSTIATRYRNPLRSRKEVKVVAQT